MKTPEEIVAYYETVKDQDIFGTLGGDLLVFVPRPLVDPYLKPDAEWGARPYPNDETLIAEMREYMPFAWEKALGERGLSASRSVQHFQAWLWLLGDSEALAFASDDSNYSPYGKPILRHICEKYGFEVLA